MPKISDMPSDTDIAADDLFSFVDVSQGRNEKITKANLAVALGALGEESLTVVNYSGSWPTRPAIAGTVLFVNATNNTAPSDAANGDLLLRTDTA